jgi:pyruvate formate lyase activating enzyme
MLKEASLYRKLPKSVVGCRTCSHYCRILPGSRGVCGVRENRAGKLFVLNYGKIVAQNIDPIEKKPFFHFLPGSKTYSIAAVGCNLRCANCQNWEISQLPKIRKDLDPKFWGVDLKPKEIIDQVLKSHCPSIAYTYTEPTVFLEFALDTMKLARKKGLKNVWVSNGFMSTESAKEIIPYLDADNIDIKGFSDDFYLKNCGARLQPILDTAKLMKKSGVWLEITTLAIPGLSDSPEVFKRITQFIKEELGPETPWHVTQFSGAISWKLQDLPETPVKTLETAYLIGKAAGLKYVYCGNVPGNPLENTYCFKCQTLAIERVGYLVRRYDKNGQCPKCGESLNIIT